MKQKQSVCDACLKPFAKTDSGKNIVAQEMFFRDATGVTAYMRICFKCYAKALGCSWKRATLNAKKITQNGGRLPE